MKYFIYILLGLTVLQFTSCDKPKVEEKVVLKDGNLSDAVWELDKMTMANGDLIPNPDVGTVFENAKIFIEFNGVGDISFTFMGSPGKGSYTIGNGNSIKVGSSYALLNEIGFDSKYRDLHYESMKALDHYSIEGRNLKLFYNNSKSIIHLVKQ
tara:strand:- start:183957 stop:184418 length:462 start_codon:yes stop_codon:yes gene_type:complete